MATSSPVEKRDGNFFRIHPGLILGIRFEFSLYIDCQLFPQWLRNPIGIDNSFSFTMKRSTQP
jgi:hypothetical protein